MVSYVLGQCLFEHALRSGKTVLYCGRDNMSGCQKGVQENALSATSALRRVCFVWNSWDCCKGCPRFGPSGPPRLNRSAGIHRKDVLVAPPVADGRGAHFQHRVSRHGVPKRFTPACLVDPPLCIVPGKASRATNNSLGWLEGGRGEGECLGLLGVLGLLDGALLFLGPARPRGDGRSL